MPTNTAPASTALLTHAEFDSRVTRAHKYTYTGVYAAWVPAGAGFLVMAATLALGDSPWAENLGMAGMIVFLGFGFAGMIVGVVRESRAPGKFGLLCGVCAQTLTGGTGNEITNGVRSTGCCPSCGAVVLRDPAAPQADEPRTPDAPPTAGPLTQPEFTRRLAEYRERVSRRVTRGIVAGIVGQLAIVPVATLPLERRARLLLFLAIVLTSGAAMMWSVFATGGVAKKLGLRCPGCQRVPFGRNDLSVARTGSCPHCATRLFATDEV